LYECFPPKVYMLRPQPEDNDTNNKNIKPQLASPSRNRQLAHKFSEVQEVLQRIARHVWPGPVTIRVAIPENHAKSNQSWPSLAKLQPYWSQLTQTAACPADATSTTQEQEASSPSSSCPYLTLRCPRHPLAIKAAQQHHATQQLQHPPRRRLSSTPSTPQQQQHQEQQHGQPTTPKTNTDPNFTSDSKPFQILVGFPIVGPQQKQQQDSYSCTSLQVQQQQQELQNDIKGVSSVLDGENHQELFAVPTCEYKKPAQTELWIHGPSRTITVVSSEQPSKCMLGSPPVSFGSPSSNEAASGWDTRLRSALRQRVPQKKGTPVLSKAKERIIQCVLCRWNIVLVQKEDI